MFEDHLESNLVFSKDDDKQTMLIKQHDSDIGDVNLTTKPGNYPCLNEDDP